MQQLVLAHNSYHLMHQASEKDFKNIKEVANAPGLALCDR
jgi:copper(I)-binding protein